MFLRRDLKALHPCASSVVLSQLAAWWPLGPRNIESCHVKQRQSLILKLALLSSQSVLEQCCASFWLDAADGGCLSGRTHLTSGSACATPGFLQRPCRFLLRFVQLPPEKSSIFTWTLRLRHHVQVALQLLLSRSRDLGGHVSIVIDRNICSIVSCQ